MRTIKLALLTVVLSLFVTQSVHAAVIAVVQDGDGFRIAINDTSSVAFAECHGNRLICASAFVLCSKEQSFGTLGDVTIGLKPALIADAFKHGQPFTTSLAGGNGTPTYLTPAGIDAETGAPFYNAPAGKTVFIVLDQKPSAGYCVGVESFYQITPATESWCVKRKAYNTCQVPVTLLTEKEFYLICSPGIFTTNQHIAQAQVTNNGDVAHAFLSIFPGLSQNKLTSGSVEAGDDFSAEFATCTATGGLATGQEVGTRWLELFVDLRPGGSTLAKAGKPGFERFFGHCVELQCDTVPPGGGCIPTCEPVPGDPGTPGEHTCPLSHGFWRNHGDAWPVSTLTLGSKSYTKAELLALLSAPTAGDASRILARQLIAAKLDIANGSDPTPIGPTITAADALLATFSGKLPYSVAPSSATGQQMTALASVLDSYVNGKLTPGCKGE